MKNNNLRIREDLDGYLSELNINEITRFEGMLGDHSFTGQVVSGGFGNAHVILNIWINGRKIQLALMESEDDDYQQDGSDPLQVDGWLWRIADSDALLTTGWCEEMHSSASEALDSAVAALASMKAIEDDDINPYILHGDDLARAVDWRNSGRR